MDGETKQQIFRRQSRGFAAAEFYRCGAGQQLGHRDAYGEEIWNNIPMDFENIVDRAVVEGEVAGGFYESFFFARTQRVLGGKSGSQKRLLGAGPIAWRDENIEIAELAEN